MSKEQYQQKWYIFIQLHGNLYSHQSLGIDESGELHHRYHSYKELCKSQMNADTTLFLSSSCGQAEEEPKAQKHHCININVNFVPLSWQQHGACDEGCQILLS